MTGITSFYPTATYFDDKENITAKSPLSQKYQSIKRDDRTAFGLIADKANRAISLSTSFTAEKTKKRSMEAKCVKDFFDELAPIASEVLKPNMRFLDGVECRYEYPKTPSKSRAKISLYSPSAILDENTSHVNAQTASYRHDLQHLCNNSLDDITNANREYHHLFMISPSKTAANTYNQNGQTTQLVYFSTMAAPASSQKTPATNLSCPSLLDDDIFTSLAGTFVLSREEMDTSDDQLVFAGSENSVPESASSNRSIYDELDLILGAAQNKL